MELKDILEFKSSPNILKRLSEIGFREVFDAGKIILPENAYIKAIPIVTRGMIKVMRRDEEGREILLYYISPGESCIMSFLGGIHRDTSKIEAVAEEDTEIHFIPMENVTVLMREFPEWLDYIFRLYHKRFEELLEVVNAVAFTKLDVRLLNLLNKKSEISENKELKITHEQIANEMGTSRVVISRLLKQMESEGLLKLGRNKISLM